MARITERELADFRREYLHPQALLAEVERRVHVLAKVPLGVGKSYAADQLLLDPETYKRFQLVIYLAPSWDVINERAIVSGMVQSPVRYMVLRPRPEERCGPFRARWKELESAGCIAFAKSELCGQCVEREDDEDPCMWPERFVDFEGTRLVFATEQQLRLNRRLLPMLLHLSGKGRALVILDEGVFIDGSFEVEVTRRDLEQLHAALNGTRIKNAKRHAIVQKWVEHLDELLAIEERDLPRTKFGFEQRLPGIALEVQRRGVDIFGNEFRFRGYELLGLPFAKPEERWIDPKTSSLHFISRPYLRHHVLLLSAHLDADYVGHRLGTTRIHSPFAKLRVEHTQTKAWNLRSWMGSDRRFSKDPRHLLDVFAVIVLRNIREGRSTVLVSRKKSKAVVASHLEKRLARWGVQVRFVTEQYDALPPKPDPRIIPIIHYGMRGRNDFEHYESAYAVNSYNVSSRTLNARLQEFEPEAFRVRMKIVEAQHRTRSVALDQANVEDIDRTALGNLYLRKLEVEPALQVMGRVRYLTRPREVVFFALHDLSSEVPNLREVAVPGMLLREMGLPTAVELDRWVRALRAVRLRGRGNTAEEIADLLGVSRATVFNLFRAEESLKAHLRYLLGADLDCFDSIEAEGRAS